MDAKALSEYESSSIRGISVTTSIKLIGMASNFVCCNKSLDSDDTPPDCNTEFSRLRKENSSEITQPILRTSTSKCSHRQMAIGNECDPVIDYVMNHNLRLALIAEKCDTNRPESTLQPGDVLGCEPPIVGNCKKSS